MKGRVIGNISNLYYIEADGKKYECNARGKLKEDGILVIEYENDYPIFKEIIGKTDYFRWPEIAGCDYQNKTVIFSFRMTGENANFLVNLGGTNRNVLDGYVFHVNTWDTIHCIAIGKGADNAKDMTQNEADMEIKLDYTAADSVWKANDLAPNDGNVYDVEISFMQNVENCAVIGCTITSTGAYGVALDHYAKYNRIVRNEMGDLGSGGVQIYGYGPGTKTTYLNIGNTVLANYIHDTGRAPYMHSAAVTVFGSGKNNIKFNNWFPVFCSFFNNNSIDSNYCWSNN